MLERHNGIELDPEGAFVYYEHAQQTVERLERELSVIHHKYQTLVNFYDQHNGTPCEQVRHQAEVDDLKQQVAQLREERDKLLEAEVELNARQFCEFAHEIALPGTRLPASPTDMITWGKFKEVVEALATAHTALRGLVEAYAKAKVEFDDKRLQEDHHAWRERYNKLVEAENALLQHHQGMEG